ncbi:HupE/UreJ family protein [Aurantibacillus circumpalustris]|uniref:HupE/UreJ family protein n=1 Tax=Aurantibacillus circumpalustris TaxID=3036359 RepID=UPI00295C1B76|nr:HupE/UreJ family protein [Aurantibacillus circumpalustris]
MNEFGLWFITGVEHILDLSGYDHILFVALLVIAFPLKQWRNLLMLITAFTVGHSISLALSVNGIVSFSIKWIEFLIALSILISAVYQIIKYKTENIRNKSFLYVIITLFGLVHGLGFSILLKSMLGHEDSIVLPLLYFNLGIELGQIIIVVIVLVFSLILNYLFKWSYTYFKLTVSCSIALIALKMSAERFLELLP